MTEPQQGEIDLSLKLQEREDKRKHLEFIQNVITRMNTNSFMIKGWAVTLVSALFALSAADTNQNFYLIAVIPAIMFWVLDGFFLATERRYVNLYKEVCEGRQSNFNMNPYFDLEFSKLDNNSISEKIITHLKNKLMLWLSIFWEWLQAMFSITFIPFYGVLTASIFIIKCWMNG